MGMPWPIHRLLIGFNKCITYNVGFMGILMGCPWAPMGTHGARIHTSTHEHAQAAQIFCPPDLYSFTYNYQYYRI